MKKIILISLFFLLWVNIAHWNEVLVKSWTNFDSKVQLYSTWTMLSDWWFFWLSWTTYDEFWTRTWDNTFRIWWNYSYINWDNAIYVTRTWYDSSVWMNSVSLYIIDKDTWEYYWDHWNSYWSTQRKLKFFKYWWSIIFNTLNSWKFYHPWDIELWINPWVYDYTWPTPNTYLTAQKRYYNSTPWNDLISHIENWELKLEWFQNVWWAIWQSSLSFLIPNLPTYDKHKIDYIWNGNYWISLYDTQSRNFETIVFDINTETFNSIPNKYILFYNNKLNKGWTLWDLDVIDYDFDFIWNPLVVWKYSQPQQEYIKYYQKTDWNLYTNSEFFYNFSDTDFDNNDTWTWTTDDSWIIESIWWIKNSIDWIKESINNIFNPDYWDWNISIDTWTWLTINSLWTNYWEIVYENENNNTCKMFDDNWEFLYKVNSDLLTIKKDLLKFNILIIDWYLYIPNLILNLIINPINDILWIFGSFWLIDDNTSYCYLWIVHKTDFQSYLWTNWTVIKELEEYKVTKWNKTFIDYIFLFIWWIIVLLMLIFILKPKE